MGWHIKADQLRKEGKNLGDIATTLNMKYKTVQRGLYRYDHPSKIVEVEGKEEPKPKYEEQDKGYTIYYGQSN